MFFSGVEATARQQKIKRTFFREAPLKKTLRSASLTVECALILPLFFMAAVTLILFMNAVSLQVRTDLALSNSARQLACAAGLAANAADAAGLAGGGNESHDAGSNAGGEGDDEAVWIDIPVSKTYQFPVSLIPHLSVKVAARARVYPWIGIRSWEGTSYAAGEGASDMVYVTDNQEVYHTHADCTHLDLTIIATTLDDVGRLRNADGRKYKPCRGFPPDYTGVIYVTAQGDFYYPSTAYGSLTRHVHLVRLSDLPALPLCGRCARKDGEHSHAAA